MTAQLTGRTTVTSLGRGRELLDPALRRAVARLDEHTRLVASYHLGWCTRDGEPVSANPGKALRPSLVMLAAEAVGGTAEDALAGAVAVELVHNFSLVHDDLMDRDTERRHRETVWSVWGEATAVLVGDAMLSLAHEVLDESPSPRAARSSRVLARATRELIRGQVLDMSFETRTRVTLAEGLEMVAGKTGALIAASAELGALLGGAGPRTVAALRDYGAQVGVAFQVVDDLLGIWGWPERTGKPVFSDLRSRKRTLPVVWAVEHGSTAGRELAAWLATAPPPGGDPEPSLRAAAGLVERAGGRAWAVQEARDRVRRALRALDGAELDPVHRTELAELAEFVVERDL
ncbi:MAG TPA: polyprenyl synthetase family protein [Nocardioides sp.]|uniref:polyprenyl synthetase family protein n=1 Tax=Nocardioides sp. TaxID=35761 RepID=UPI002E2F30CB|nr:polyprenyl synthetase family protein [Nocardioides sp.]HEX5087644.1 polyprenyl synthetase family protein [Nocardioides sp.]